MTSTYASCSKAEVELFNPVGVQSRIIGSSYAKYSNENTLENCSTVSVTIPPDQVNLIDLHDCSLKVGFKIVKAGGADITDADLVAPCNLAFTSLFKRVEVFVGGVQVDCTNDYDAHKNFMNVEFSYGAAAKRYTLPHMDITRI